MKTILFSLLTSLTLITPSFAGDASTAAAIGFSKDGKYFGWLEYGIQDGSGTSYAKANFLNVHTNLLAVIKDKNGKPIKIDGFSTNDEEHDPGMTQVRYNALVRARPGLRYLGISKANLAIALASRKLTDVSPNSSATNLQFQRFPALRGFQSSPYELNIQNLKLTADKNCKGNAELYGSQTVGFKLTLKSINTGKSVVLQSDEGKSIPSSRGCPIDYRIQDVIAYEGDYDHVVVLLNVISNGFEGDDARTIAVSGKLPE